MFGLVPFVSKRNLSKNNGDFHSLFDVFNDSFFNDFMMPTNLNGSAFKVDVKDNGNTYELIADFPGMKKENINLNYENSYLTISAKTEEGKDEQDDKGNYIRRERHVGSMSRSFYIDNIDENKISAEFKDGILKVDLPKKVEDMPKSKQIEIK